ncbi:MAG: DUF6261 family protein [Odoribacteraceae bacterium]|jgi:hypothetical protein|nr:DUF6261 family protein [Odoribacteraceae bacterium]
MKEHLENMPLHRFRGETLASAARSVHAAATSIGAGAIGIQESIDELDACLDRVSGSLDQADKSGLTAEIREQDRLRGNIARGLAAVAKAYLLYPDRAKRAAAERLVIILDRYGDLHRKTYDDESAAIEDLVKELSNATHAPMVILLGLGEWVTLLDNANKAFGALMLQRYAERTRRAVPMKVARMAMEEKMRKIVARLESIITLYGIDFSPELALFVKEYNEIAKRYKDILARERGHRKAHRTDDSTGDSTGPAEE